MEGSDGREGATKEGEGDSMIDDLKEAKVAGRSGGEGYDGGAGEGEVDDGNGDDGEGEGGVERAGDGVAEDGEEGGGPRFNEATDTGLGLVELLERHSAIEAFGARHSEYGDGKSLKPLFIFKK